MKKFERCANVRAWILLSASLVVSSPGGGSSTPAPHRQIPFPHQFDLSDECERRSGRFGGMLNSTASGYIRCLRRWSERSEILVRTTIEIDQAGAYHPSKTQDGFFHPPDLEQSP
jgi:hypothetical protein